jgi:orotate phosphoribosyltransferase
MLAPSYHTPILTTATRKIIIRNIKKYLKDNPDVVAIAGTGLSGIPLVAIVSHLTGLHPIYIRSKGSEAHDEGQASSSLDGPVFGKLSGRYIILDDLVDSGATVERIESVISDFNVFVDSGPKAVLLYRSHNNRGLEGVPNYFVGKSQYASDERGRYIPKKKKAKRT